MFKGVLWWDNSLDIYYFNYLNTLMKFLNYEILLLTLLINISNCDNIEIQLNSNKDNKHKGFVKTSSIEKDNQYNLHGNNTFVNKINNNDEHDYSEDNNSSSNSNGNNCNTNFLGIFNITGFNVPKKIKYVSKICPNISSSCCSKSEIIKLLFIWKNNIREKIQKYYETYLEILLKILNYRTKVEDIASKLDINNYKKNPLCQEIIKDIPFYLNNISETNKIYKFYSMAFELLAYTRKGTYCAVCNHENHSFFNLNGKNKYELIISEEFCSDITTMLHQYMKYKINNVVPFLISTNNLNNCINNQSEIFHYNFNKFSYSDFDDCFNQYDAPNPNANSCKKFCKQFNLTKISDIIEGDIRNLYNFFKRLFDNNEISHEEFSKINISAITSNLFSDANFEYDIKIESKGINLLRESNNNGFLLTINSDNKLIFEDVRSRVKGKSLKSSKGIDKEYNKFESKVINTDILNTISDKYISELIKKLKISKLNANEKPTEEFIKNMNIKELETKYINDFNNKFIDNIKANIIN